MSLFVTIVLDGVGIGAQPDAALYGEPDAHTLGHVLAQQRPHDLDTLPFPDRERRDGAMRVELEDSGSNIGQPAPRCGTKSPGASRSSGKAPAALPA